jgi:hypothetical protein
MWSVTVKRRKAAHQMPSLTNADRAEQVAALRTELGLDDLVPVRIFAAAVRKSTRTVERAIDRRELDVVWVGRTPHISISRARQGYLASRNVT